MEANDRTSASATSATPLAHSTVCLPVFEIASNGTIRWVNLAAEQIVGDKKGRPLTEAVALESKAAVRDAFASKVVGSRAATDYDATLVAKDGTRVNVEICSVPVDGGAGIAGVFGAAAVKGQTTATDAQARERKLTPRQAEVLGYLARGYKTDDMAAAMGVSKETVRNLRRQRTAQRQQCEHARGRRHWFRRPRCTTAGSRRLRSLRVWGALTRFRFWSLRLGP
jgi:hypothetical protein